MWIGTLGDHQSVTVAKLKILIHLTFQSMKGKLHFENGVKAYDTGIITRKHNSKFPNNE